MVKRPAAKNWSLWCTALRCNTQSIKRKEKNAAWAFVWGLAFVPPFSGMLTYVHICIYVYIFIYIYILISSDDFMLHFFAPRFPSGWPPTTSVARESAEQISPGFDGTLWGWERPKTQGLGLGLVNGCVPKWAQKHPVGFFQNHFRGNQNGYMIFIYIYMVIFGYLNFKKHTTLSHLFLKINPYLVSCQDGCRTTWDPRSRHRRCCLRNWYGMGRNC